MSASIRKRKLYNSIRLSADRRDSRILFSKLLAGRGYGAFAAYVFHQFVNNRNDVRVVTTVGVALTYRLCKNVMREG